MPTPAHLTSPGVRVAFLFAIALICAPSRAVAQAQPDTLQRLRVLYDTTGQYGHLGELYGQALSTMLSRFGHVEVSPVKDYRAGEIDHVDAVVYVGSTYDEPLPRTFLTDVLRGERPVLWIGANIWQLLAAAPHFAEHYGFLPTAYSTTNFSRVLYKGEQLDRNPVAGQLLRVRRLDPSLAKVLASAEAADGRQTPWAITARGLTYIAENPLTYLGSTDRYFAFCDILFDVLPKARPQLAQHRALARIEDVHPASSPEKLREFADYFASVQIPFAVALVPFYEDPLGKHNAGVPVRTALHEAPDVVEALKYMVARGATLVLHGCTHQYGDTSNPYSGASIDDAEFLSAHVDGANNVVWNGPVTQDSKQWAQQRIARALAEIDLTGLPRPSIFEYPHYAGSVVDSLAIAAQLPTAFHRPTFYAGALSGGPIDYAHSLPMFFPFVVRDTYGWRVLPETLGNYIPTSYNNQSIVLAPDIGRAARAQSVVRDGVAGFFFHVTQDLGVLREIVRQVHAAGYTFVSPSSL